MGVIMFKYQSQEIEDLFGLLSYEQIFLTKTVEHIIYSVIQIMMNVTRQMY